MTLHQFELFISTAKRLNVTQVSRELHISQSSISRELKRLQEEYGVKFFKRTGRGLELTKNGQSFLKDVDSILTQVAGLKTKYSGNKTASLHKDYLSVGGSYGPSATILPSVMAQFRRANPEIHLSIKTRPGREIIELVLQSHVDLAVKSTWLS